MALTRTIHKGPISSKTKETDGAIFIPGFAFMFPDGTWTATRVAVGDIRMRKTAGAATTHPTVDLTEYSTLLKIGTDPNWDAQYNTVPANLSGLDLLHDIRGFQVTSIDVISAIGTANLTSATPVINRITYADDAAPVVVAVGGALTISQGGLSLTFDPTQINVDTITLATPFILGNNSAEVAEWFEIAIVDPGTSVYDLIGIWVKGNYNIL